MKGTRHQKGRNRLSLLVMCGQIDELDHWGNDIFLDIYRQKCLCPVISSVAIGLKTISYLICLWGQMHCILFDIWHKKPTNIYGFYLEMNEKMRCLYE